MRTRHVRGGLREHGCPTRHCRSWSGRSTCLARNELSRQRGLPPAVRANGANATPCEEACVSRGSQTSRANSGLSSLVRAKYVFARTQTLVAATPTRAQPVRTMRTLHRPRRRAQSAAARPVSTTRLCRGTARARDHASARAFEISRAILGLVELGLDKVSVSFGTNYHDSDACHERSRCERCERDTVRGGMREQGVANVEG